MRRPEPYSVPHIEELIKHALNARNNDGYAGFMEISENKRAVTIKDRVFEDMHFNKILRDGLDLIFERCTFNKLIVDARSFPSLFLSDCKIKTLLKVGDEFFRVKVLEINNGCSIKEVQVEGDFGRLYVLNSNIEKLLAKRKVRDLEFKESVIHEIEIRDGEGQKVQVLNSEIKILRIENTTLNEFSIQEGHILETLLITDVKRPDYEGPGFEISASWIGMVLVKNSDLLNIVFKPVKGLEQFIQSVFVNDCRIKKLEILRNYVGHLKVSKTDCRLEDSWIFSLVEFNQIDYFDSSVKGDQLFVNCRTLLFDKVNRAVLNWNAKTETSTNESEYNLPQYEVPQFAIHSSSFGKTKFISCDFNKSTFHLLDSDIIDIIVIGTALPVLVTSTNTGKNFAYEQMRDGYSQLKRVYENRADRITSLKYAAAELEAHRKHLNKIKSPNKGERVMLWLNKCSNSYGESWWRALVITLALLVLFYSGYCLTLGIVNIHKPDLEYTTKVLSLSFEFLNPIHKTSEIATQLEVTNPSGWAIAIEGISRILFGYMLYQLIAAFRKYGKQG